jgi:hypothetical protein
MQPVSQHDQFQTFLLLSIADFLSKFIRAALGGMALEDARGEIGVKF